MVDIEFTMTIPNLELTEFPSPSIKLLPDWYKNMSSYTGGVANFNNGNVNHTVKKCVPVLDSLGIGYTIPLWTDVLVFKEDGQTVIGPSNDRSGIKVVEGHPPEQIPGYPFPKGHDKDVYKWINPWHIKTKKGYSCLFINPTHRELPFRIMEGVVDTDTFPLSINFPFFLEKGFEGIIPYGTPMAQIIPFKRDVYRSKRGKFDPVKYEQLHNLHDSVHKNKYKLKWWSRKEYK